MHRIDRHEHRRIADRRRRHAAYGGFGMAVVVHVGIVEHDLPASAQRAATVRLAFDEAIDDTAVEILGARPRRQIKACVADSVVDAVEIEGIAHQRMPDAVAAARPRLVAEQHDLRLGELDARGARGDGRVKVQILADLLGARGLNLAERDGDAERGRTVRHTH